MERNNNIACFFYGSSACVCTCTHKLVCKHFLPAAGVVKDKYLCFDNSPGKALLSQCIIDQSKSGFSFLCRSLVLTASLLCFPLHGMHGLCLVSSSPWLVLVLSW